MVNKFLAVVTACIDVFSAFKVYHVLLDRINFRYVYDHAFRRMNKVLHRQVVLEKLDRLAALDHIVICMYIRYPVVVFDVFDL